MRPARLLPALLLGAALAAPTGASAGVPHTVAPGETLWSLAAAQNMTTRAFAAANGLSENATLIAGSTIQLPTVTEAAIALQSAPAATAQAAADASAAPATTTTAGPPPMGAYTVRPGDTLSDLAAQSGVSVEQMAAMNGLDPNAYLIAGTLIKLPTGAPTPAAASEPAPAPVVTTAAPNPAPGTVTSSQIAEVATRNGVPADLSAAIAWQESGFNNAMVSAANARGVMQVMPGTWDWVQANLAKRQLDPNSPIDNVGAGVLYLGHLLQETGGDYAQAAAAYYQGLESVRRIGMLPETQQYVANVMALRSRFGG